MLKLTVHYIKLLLILILNLIFRFKKYILYIYYDKHEFERVCKDPCDIYEKTMKIDQWLHRTNCEKILQYWTANISYETAENTCLHRQTIEQILRHYKHHVDNKTKPSSYQKSNVKIRNINDKRVLVRLEDGDKLLCEILCDTTEQFLKVIKQSKRAKLTPSIERVLRDTIYRIISYNFSLMVMLKMAALPYDSALKSHTTLLTNLWNNLVRLDKNRCLGGETGSRVFPPDIGSEMVDDGPIPSRGRWSHIGFQGEDPGTDFRGMGLLGLGQLEYISRRSKYLALDLLERSLNRDREYPFAIVGINITYNLVNLFKDGSMKHLYYDCGDVLFRTKHRELNLIRTINDLYIELFLRFDCFWHESKPENIFAFRELMEKFISIIKMDLCNRSFSFKFIY